jgi:hypothetical protein
VFSQPFGRDEAPGSPEAAREFSLWLRAAAGWRREALGKPRDATRRVTFLPREAVRKAQKSTVKHADAAVNAEEMRAMIGIGVFTELASFVLPS